MDPVMDLEQNARDPQGWNRYAYVGNRPTRILDPDGRAWGLLLKALRVIVKGGNLAATAYETWDDIKTVGSSESSSWERVVAGVNILSPIDLRKGSRAAKAAVRRAEDAAADAGDGLRRLPRNAHTTTDPLEAYRRLEKYHGVSAQVASERLHQIKRAAGLGGADSVTFDLTGNVYDQFGVWIGSLTQGGGG